MLRHIILFVQGIIYAAGDSVMNKLSALGILLALVFAAILLVLLFPRTANDNTGKSGVCFRQDCFTVELALTPEQQEKGLMGRESLPPGSGMLFVFPEEGVYPFWMKNTLIPLDMIWMDSNGTVVFIGKDEQPCGLVECPIINPGVRARYVLEVDAGTAERIGLEEGNGLILHISA